MTPEIEQPRLREEAVEKPFETLVSEYIETFETTFREKEKRFRDMKDAREEAKNQLRVLLRAHQDDMRKKGIALPNRPEESFEITPDMIPLLSLFETIGNEQVNQKHTEIRTRIVSERDPKKRQELLRKAFDEMQKQPIHDSYLVMSLFQDELQERYFDELKTKKELSKEEAKLVFEIFYSREVNVKMHLGKSAEAFAHETFAQFLQFLTSRGLSFAPTEQWYLSFCQENGIADRLKPEREMTAEQLLSTPTIQREVAAKMDPMTLTSVGPSAVASALGGVGTLKGNNKVSSLLTGLIRVWGVTVVGLSAAGLGAKIFYVNGKSFLTSLFQFPPDVPGALKAFGQNFKDIKDTIFSSTGVMAGLGVLAARGALDPQYLAPRVADLASRGWEWTKEFVGKSWSSPRDIPGRMWESMKHFGSGSFDIGKRISLFFADKGSRAWEFTVEEWHAITGWGKDLGADVKTNLEHYRNYYLAARKLSDLCKTQLQEKKIVGLDSSLTHFDKDRYDSSLKEILQKSLAEGNKPPTDISVRELNEIGYFTATQALDLQGKGIEKFSLPEDFAKELLEHAKWISLSS